MKNCTDIKNYEGDKTKDQGWATIDEDLKEDMWKDTEGWLKELKNQTDWTKVEDYWRFINDKEYMAGKKNRVMD